MPDPCAGCGKQITGTVNHLDDGRYCDACARKELKTKFTRGEDSDHVEWTILGILGLSEYDNFDDVPNETIEKIKCPYCGGRELACYGKADAVFLGSVDCEKRYIEDDEGLNPEMDVHYLYCNGCQKDIEETDIRRVLGGS